MNKDDTNPYGIPVVVKKRSRKSHVFLLVFFGLIIITMGTYLVLNIPKGEERYILRLAKLEDKINKIKLLESEIRIKQIKFYDLLRDYEGRSGKDLNISDIVNLSEKEKIALDELISEEKDSQLKDQLEEILKIAGRIKELAVKVRTIEQSLTDPHVVKRGESHYQIAFDFLLKKSSLNKKKAKKLMRKIKLYDTLIPGFKVWNYHSGNVFGSFITRGNAPFTTDEAITRAKKRILSSREKAIRKLNSVYYLADTKKRLLERGIIKSRFLQSSKIDDLSPKYFTRAIDLRKKKFIKIYATSLNIKEFSDIALLPRYYKKGRDFDININKDKTYAIITLFTVEKFKGAKIIISVE